MIDHRPVQEDSHRCYRVAQEVNAVMISGFCHKIDICAVLGFYAL